MKKMNKWMVFGLLVAALVLVNIIGAFTPGQLDLTSNRLYTLSEGSKGLLRKIDEPVTLRFYFSRSVEGVPISFKNYATRVEELLRQYQRAARGRVFLEVVNPRPDTPEEEAAIRAGVSGQPLPTGETLFFGLVVTQAEQEEVIPFFNPQREEFIEYDISKAIHRVQQWALPKLGVISSLPVFGDEPPPFGMPQQPQARSEWVFLQELRSNFEIRRIRGDSIPDDVDVLAVIHPQDLSEKLLFAIDQFVLGGGPAFIAVDPSSYLQKSQMDPQQMMMGMQQPTSSDLDRLFDRWGIEFDSGQVLGDLEFAASVNTGRGQAVSYPVWLNINRFNQETPPTAELNQMLFPEPGSFQVSDAFGLELTPLIRSSTNSSTLMAAMLGFTSPEDVSRQITPDGKERVIAGMVRGNLRTAFPDGPPRDNEEEEEEEIPLTVAAPSLTSGNADLVVVADTDFLADQFSVRFMNFLGMRAMAPLNDNIAFVSNVLDFLAGSEDLIGLRSKGSSVRPFERVRELEIRARQTYQEQLAALENRLQEVQENLRDLQARQQEQGQLVASPEVREMIERFRLEEAAMRAERREIRKKLREDIESLKMKLITFNLAAVPLLVIVLGGGFLTLRGKRQKK